ncbi:response regulator [Paenibacillus sp. CF384]|uniref:response regulator n=1 Tax=Paenibacillus sp. CF384 TaxID=1884382 RepID=UPI00089BE97D|nr:response regulator [Paenibacillus sp. CF384]SDX79616.1 two-component system, response regulator YesN [Paenibacillus sp. CF384]
MKALIVDDERHVREAIRLLVPWQQFGIETVLEADDGTTGMAMIQAERPALVFTDMMMPMMGGDKLMEWMAEHAPDSKIIVISGHDTFDFVRTAVKFGGMDYILKPIDADQLTSAVERAVNSWRSEDASRSRARGQDIELNQLKPLYTEQLLAALMKGNGSAQEFALAMKPFGMAYEADGGGGIAAGGRIEGGGGITAGCRTDGVDRTGEDAATATSAVSQTLIRTAIVELSSTPLAVAEKFGSSGRDLFAYAVANIVNEMLRERGAGHAFRHHAGSEQEIVLLFWDGTVDVPGLLVECNDALFVALKARLAIGVGLPVAFPSGLTASYRQARTALMQRNLLQTGKCIHCFEGGAASASVTEPALFFSSYEERVRYAVQSGSPENIRRALQLWFDALDQRNRLTPENLLLWQREFQLAAAIWEGGRNVEGVGNTYAGDSSRSLPVDTGGAFLYAAWKEAFFREACEIGARLNAVNERGSTIRDIAAHIEKFAHEDLTLQSISDKFHLSREYISRKFKQELNQNVSDFITACRINRAKILLASAHLKITQVAEMSGFQDEKYFSKVFKKLMDCTPSEFRKRQYGME